MIDDPPVEPAVNATETVESPAVTDEMVGAPGTVRGVNEPDASEAAPEPAVFTARNFTVYAVPLVRPGIATGDEVSAGDNATHEPAPFNWYS